MTRLITINIRAMKYFFLLGFTILVISCNQKQKSLEILGHCADTTLIENKVYCLDSISETAFNSIDYRFPMNYDTISLDTSFIKISKDSLTIKTEKKIVSFKNIIDEKEPASCASYEYMYNLNSIGYVFIRGNFWEWRENYLVNLKTGEITNILNNPIFSPNRKLFVSCNPDLFYTPETNGFEFYSVENGLLRKVFDKRLKNWAPVEIKWESDSSIVMKRLKINQQYDFRRMVLKK